MRRTHAPSNFMKKSTAFPQVTRSTNELLHLLNCTANKGDIGISLSCDSDNLKPVEKSICDDQKSVLESELQKKLYNVVWSKQTKKKHKTWEGDGILEVTFEYAVLKDTNGTILGRSSKIKIPIEEGNHIFVGSKEVEIISTITNKENISTIQATTSTFDEPQFKTNNLVKRPKKRPRVDSGFVVPLPGADNEPLIMPRPDYTHQMKCNPENHPVFEVKLDLFLSRILREHQQQGILFLYSCITGIRDVNFNGAILADEMGLGKTLQCISLIWILLKNGPYGGIPLVQRVLIVTPSSLVTNWLKEFKKWLGFERLRPYTINKKQKLCDYVKTAASLRPVLITSYEMLVKHIEELKNCNFQLLICDEGHRLKNSQIQASQALSQLCIKRRVILTGTPVQNNLQEFYALIEFVNPGILGTSTEFRRYYEVPIVQSNQPNCPEEIKELGLKRANELNHRTNSFILRRTQSIIDKYLPSKQECVIFCSPTKLQAKLYESTILYWESNIFDGVPKVPHLNVITTLKKICNDPRLLKVSDKGKDSDDDEDIEFGSFGEELLRRLQPVFENFDFSDMDLPCSGKMIILENLLHEMIDSKEKIVLISYFTQTLDLLQNLCLKKNYNFLRLDGTMTSSARSEAVDKLNAHDSKYFVFLLSAKAGGVGLNLVGASRLVLFDLDWNPASDLQAMSRIWRDGQKRDVFIYRFLTTGSIEEKIYQRQISKTLLSDAVVDISNTSSARLSVDELKDLFTFKPECNSFTHELICDCEGCGIPENILYKDENLEESRPHQLSIFDKNSKTKSDLKISELMEWEHYTSPVAEHVLKELYLESASDFISYVFRNKTLAV